MHGGVFMSFRPIYVSILFILLEANLKHTLSSVCPWFRETLGWMGHKTGIMYVRMLAASKQATLRPSYRSLLKRGRDRVFCLSFTPVY